MADIGNPKIRAFQGVSEWGAASGSFKGLVIEIHLGFLVYIRENGRYIIHLYTYEPMHIVVLTAEYAKNIVGCLARPPGPWEDFASIPGVFLRSGGAPPTW